MRGGEVESPISHIPITKGPYHQLLQLLLFCGQPHLEHILSPGELLHLLLKLALRVLQLCHIISSRRIQHGEEVVNVLILLLPPSSQESRGTYSLTHSHPLPALQEYRFYTAALVKPVQSPHTNYVNQWVRYVAQALLLWQLPRPPPTLHIIGGRT